MTLRANPHKHHAHVETSPSRAASRGVDRPRLTRQVTATMTTETTDTTDEPNPHAGLEFSCPTKVGDEKTRTVQHRNGDTHEETYRERCGTTLTYEDHYIGMAGTTTARREGYEQDALVFKCPDCGEKSYRCMICSDSQQPGWYRGESTGEMLACHNCNAQEAQRQMREERGGRRW